MDEHDHSDCDFYRSEQRILDHDLQRDESWREQILQRHPNWLLWADIWNFRWSTHLIHDTCNSLPLVLCVWNCLHVVESIYCASRVSVELPDTSGFNPGRRWSLHLHWGLDRENYAQRPSRWSHGPHLYHWCYCIANGTDYSPLPRSNALLCHGRFHHPSICLLYIA